MTETETIALPGGGKARVVTNVPLAGNKTVDRAVVVVHGTDRNAHDYYARMRTAARKAGVEVRTAVLAPWFDKAWPDTWKQGGLSGGVSSFEVVDQLLALLADPRLFPNVVRVTVAGHSAGAQFTQRHAVFGAAPTRLPVNWLVANPSSFVYLDGWRPAPTKGCSSYNKYKYGLDRRPPGYVAALTDQQARSRYTGRAVTVANGGDDVTDDGDLDTSCAANTQGPHRLARGRAFTDRVRLLYPDAPHSYVVVPGVGHDSARMFQHSSLRPALFGVR